METVGWQRGKAHLAVAIDGVAAETSSVVPETLLHWWWSSTATTVGGGRCLFSMLLGKEKGLGVGNNFLGLGWAFKLG